MVTSTLSRIAALAAALTAALALLAANQAPPAQAATAAGPLDHEECVIYRPDYVNLSRYAVCRANDIIEDITA